MTPQDLQTLSIFLQTVAIFASIVFIIIGWKVLYKNAKRIASRNEAYALLMKTQDEILNIEKLGYKFWTDSTNRSKCSSYVLAIRIQSILTLLDLLEPRGFAVDPHDIYKLRNAITMDSETPDKLAEDTIRKKLVNISHFSTQIQTALHKEFLNNYQHIP